jgi:PTS system nitrogen regulatory IIA component
MKISEMLSEDLIQPDLGSRDRESVLREMVHFLNENNRVTNAGQLLDRLLQREKMGSTAIGRGVAIPHCKFKGIAKPLVMAGLSRQGIAFEAVDGKPVHLFFIVVTPPDTPNDSLRILALIARLVRRSKSLIKNILQAKGSESLLDIIREEEDRRHE